MKNKKGFTLVEIIVCITLIIIIGVSTFIGFKVYKNSDKDKEKVITDITSAADVYYEANENIKEKLENNYGYLVLDIQELKDNGIIDENKKIPELTNEEENEGKTYEKLVIDGSDDELGLTDIIYPYEKNKNLFMMNLYKLYIEEFEKNEFMCNTELNKIDYMNEDYEIVSNENFLCGIDELENDIDSTDYTNLSLNTGTNYIRYKINLNDKDITGVRNVYVSSGYNPSLKAITKEDSNVYECGTYINQDVILYLEDNDNKTDRNLSFVWYKDSNLISNEDTYTASESGIYKVSYELKGKISNIAKTDNKECKVLIDKNKPIIDISINNKMNVNITDSDSGVYGYLKSDSKLEENNLTKDKFTKGSSFSFNKPSKSTTYYIYAMDNAGNINEKIYETIGDEDYPEITYEPIENSFTKFKVTIKDISDKGYNINDIKVQFEYDKNKYKFYNSDYNPGRYDKDNLQTFLNNYTYNKEYDTTKQNYIDLTNDSSYECSDNECSFTIDMEQQIKTCENKRYCKRIVDYSDLYNLSLNYYIKATNTKGYYKEIKLNSVLNIYEDESAFNGKWFFFGNYDPRLIGTNLNGDILFSEHLRDSGTTTVRIYYYDTKNSITNEIGTYINWPSISYDWFDNYSLGFTTCNTYYRTSRNKKIYYKEYNRYEYDLETGELINYESYNRQDRSSCNFKTSVDKVYESEKYTKKYENGKYLSEYLNRLRDWEKTSVDNPTRHKVDSSLDNYIFYSTKSGKTWQSILTYDVFKNGGQSRSRGDYNKLFFLPEVSLEKKNISVGTTS